MAGESLFENLLAYYDSIGWSYDRVPDAEVASMLLDTTSWQITLVGTASEDTRILTLFARPEKGVSAEHMPAIMELLTHINFQLVDGCWAMDPQDGELRFRISGHFPNGPPSKEDLERLHRFCIAGHDSYYKPIGAILDGESTLGGAIAWLYG
jgi:hypothetical protein